MKAWSWMLSLWLVGCSGTQAQQSVAQEPAGTPTGAPAPANTASADRAITRPDTAPNFTISEAQAEAACDKGAQKALKNEDKDLRITVALCQKLQEMFPNSAVLQHSLATLYQLNGSVDKAATLQKSACDAAKAANSDPTQVAKFCAPLPKALGVVP